MASVSLKLDVIWEKTENPGTLYGDKGQVLLYHYQNWNLGSLFSNQQQVLNQIVPENSSYLGTAQCTDRYTVTNMITMFLREVM